MNVFRGCTYLLALSCVLLAPCVRGSEAPAATRTQVLALTAQEPEAAGKLDGGLLIRELARQALLIAARDELGMATRDQTLREPLPSDAALTLALKTSFTAGSEWDLMVSKVGAPPNTPAVLWSKKIPLGLGSIPDYAQLAVIAEELSRKDFVAMLKAAGLSGTPNAVNPAATVPAETEKHLLHLTCLAQFASMRPLHAALRKQGESPALLSALVRGYANLSQLTRAHWNAAFRAYQARALLYAQRSVVRTPDSPVALWARAYALALCGRHAAALNDIAAATKIAPEAKKGFGWHDAIELYCHFDTQKLAAYADPDYTELALFLRFLTVECGGSHGEIQDAVYAMLEANPGCFRVNDALWQMRGVSALHKATTESPELMERTLYKRLGAMPELPQTLTALLTQTEDTPDTERREKVLNAFAAESARDRGEPSWAVLGRMMQEETFVQVYMRAEFMKNIWGVDTSEYLEQAMPLIATHPYKNAVAVMELDYQRQGNKVEETLQPVSLIDATFAERTLIDFTWRMNTGTRNLGQRAFGLAMIHNDDLDYGMEFRNKPVRARMAHLMLNVSPYNPVAYAQLITEDWPFAKDHAEAWERDFGQHAQVLGALANRYLETGALPAAERCLQAYIKISPDRWSYDALAELYKRQGNMDKWQATLDEYLANVQDPGLEHANVRVKIARFFMSQGQYAKAQPYADAAAQTWAAWAMGCARDCHEGMGDFAAAETWQKRISERYEDSQFHWYLWCVRTGHGSVKEAGALSAQHFEEIAGRATGNDLIDMGLFELLQGNVEKAEANFEKTFTQTHDPWSGIQAALCADTIKNTGLRDRLLKDVLDHGAEFKSNKNQPRNEMIAAARAFVECLQKGANGKLDLAALNTATGKAGSQEAANIHYFVGRFLELHGTQEQAIDYYQRSASSGYNQKYNVLLSIQVLRRLNVKPNDGKPGKNEF